MCIEDKKPYEVTALDGRKTPNIVGRKRVGVVCDQGWECHNDATCTTVYVQDFLNDDGSCPHFVERRKKFR